MIMAAAPFFMAGTLYEPALAVGVIYLLFLGLYVVLDALILPRRGQITVTRTVPERISLGVPCPVTFLVHNRSIRRLKISLAEDLPENAEAQPPECTVVLAPEESRTLQYRLLARKRGRYDLAEVDVRMLPWLGLLCRQFRLRMPAQVQVFPNLVNIKRYELLLRRGLSYEQGLAALRQIGYGWEFESLRHYTDGDDLSRVDWKATARTANLIVRNYEAERRQSVLIAIDVGRATAGEFEGLSRLDYLVNAAQMLAYVVLRQGDWFSLIAFSDRIESYLPPVRQLANLDRVSRTLYHLESRLVESDYAAACHFISLKHRKRSLICLMTDVLDRQASSEIIAHMGRYARYHLPLAVTLANPEVRTTAWQPLKGCRDPYVKAVALDVLSAREEALGEMRHQGVDVLDVDPHALTPELINRYLHIKASRRL